MSRSRTRTRSFRIELAEVADVSSIALVWMKANDARRDRNSQEDAADIEELIRSRLREADASLFVTKDAGRIVGVGHQLPARANDGAGDDIVPGLMHLSMIAVEPSYWGRGIGRAITVACLERATDLGYEAVQLWTQASNVRAHRLYANLGFELTGRDKIDECGENIKLLRRTLVR